MRTGLGLGLLAVLAVACSSGSGTTNAPTSADGIALMPGFDPGPAPASGKGFQVVTPIVTDIEPGGSYEYCTWTNITLDHDVWVKSSQGLQSTTGHHTVVYYTMNPQPAGQSRICNDADMATFRFALGAGGEGVAEKNELPGDLAVLVPKGAQIVVNHHYLNASSKTVAQAQSAVNVVYADPSSKITRASSLAFVDTDMTVPVGQSAVDFTCTVKEPLQTWSFLPHMHNWGTRITIDHVSPSGSDRLFDVNWDPSYSFHPPTKTLDPSAPLVFNAGDQVKIHCEYSNTTNAPLTFGMEMCIGFAMTVDTGNLGNISCDNGHWGAF